MLGRVWRDRGENNAEVAEAEAFGLLEHSDWDEEDDGEDGGNDEDNGFIHVDLE